MIATQRTIEADYLPARMLNEFTYCPRLFYYEHVEGVFAHNQETVEGELIHSRVDARQDDLPPPEELAESGRRVRARSVTLSSDTYGVIAKLDLLESEGGTVTPVDYKRGRPCREDDGSLDAWDTDRIQLAIQALILRDNGFRCEEAIVYYAATRQRVRIAVDEALLQAAIDTISAAASTAANRQIPPPLIDSPKCPRCSLVGICLPDETQQCRAAPAVRVQKTLFDIEAPRDAAVGDGRDREEPLRRLIAARDELRPLYLNTQGLYVGKSGEVLKIKEKDRVVQEVRIREICQLNLMGNIQLTTQAIQALCWAEVPIAYFSMGGWFYGVTQALGVKNIFLRREQFRLADAPAFCLRLARALVAGKIRNQRTMLQRNHIEPPRGALVQMKCMQQDAARATEMDQLLGLEGNAARVYFENFAGMIKPRDSDPVALRSTGCQPVSPVSDLPASPDADPPWSDDNAPTPDACPTASVAEPMAPAMRFDFSGRNRRPPRDPVNALLSLGYSLLAKDLTIVTQTVGFDPYLGYYHQPRFGRASLALDLMEPFRPLIVDSAVLSAVNTGMVTSRDFVRAGQSVALTAEGRKKFFMAYEQRMDTLVTHPLFGYRVNYRRLLEIQTRLLARLLTGEIWSYPVFTTR
ncbi:MAG: CRISPR-associated endonuclease Cas1 [Pirellulaceae bacterium]|nr:CRISPR-associated endonuclease Cas1 [Pirellulaceae bacterium]